MFFVKFSEEYINWFSSKSGRMGAYHHFKKRLLERHDMTLTLPKYLDYCYNFKFYLLGKSPKDSDKQVGYIWDGKRQIHVVRSIKDKVFITVLPRYSPVRYIKP